MDSHTSAMDCAASTERRKHSNIWRGMKNVVYVKKTVCEGAGTEKWNENILIETNSISSTCSVKY